MLNEFVTRKPSKPTRSCYRCIRSIMPVRNIDLDVFWNAVVILGLASQISFIVFVFRPSLLYFFLPWAE